MASVFENKLTAHRAKIDQAWREHRGVEEVTSRDADLNAAAKRRIVDESKQRLREVIARLEREEAEAIEAEIIRLERQIFGARSATDSMALIAARDADDRAARLESSDEAEGMLHRALRSDDNVLALAVARKAIENGWVEVTERFKAERPGQAQAFGELGAVIRFRDNWHRTAVYLVP